MSQPWDGSDNRYQTLLQTKKDIFSASNSSKFPQFQPLDKESFDKQLRIDKDRQNFFANNSSQILNNSSIPVNIYPVDPNQYQSPPSQMNQRDLILAEKTRKKQNDLLSASYQGERQMSNGALDLNNYMKNPNNDDSFTRRFPESNARSFLNSRSNVEKPGLSYGMDLKKQILVRENEKKSSKLREKLLEQKMLVDRYNNDWFGKQGSGAPIRDKFGNILTSRKKPNYNSTEWNPNMGNASLSANMRLQEENNLRNSMSNLNEMSMISNRNLNDFNGQNANIANIQHQEQMKINVLPPRDTSERPMSIPDLNIDMGPISDIEAFNRKEKEKSMQKENYYLMEAKRKEKENERLIKKQEADLLDLKIQKEKEETEARRMFTYGNQNLESRNLYETNFDFGKLLGKTSQLNFAPNRTLRENTQVQFTLKTDKNNSKRPRTPIEEVERDMRELKLREEGLTIQRRLMQELPFEVSKTVQTTVDIEMQKLKNELNFQQNLLGEQIMGLKGQLLQSNEYRQESDKEVKKLQQEIQKTQLVDEIRQRELYMALILKNRKPTIYHTITQRLQDAEPVNFKFPERPKPYYNVYDPSIEDIEFRNKDLHEIINNRTELIPISVHDEKMIKGGNWDQNLSEMQKYSYGVAIDNDKMPNLLDDFGNLQGITQPRIIDDGDQVYYLDTYKTNIRRLEDLDKDPKQELANLDHQLFHLLNKVDNGKGTFDDLNKADDQYSLLGKAFNFNDQNADFYD